MNIKDLFIFKFVFGLFLMLFGFNVFATAPDFSTLTAAVDYSTVIAAVLTVMAALGGVYIVMAGGSMILSKLRGR